MTGQNVIDLTCLAVASLIFFALAYHHDHRSHPMHHLDAAPCTDCGGTLTSHRPWCGAPDRECIDCEEPDLWGDYTDAGRCTKCAEDAHAHRFEREPDDAL